MTEFQTILSPSTTEFKDRGSKFIAYAFPIQSVEEFKQRLNEIKKEHPKATHYCFAYRLGTAGDNFRVSDDGEPSGSAGRPILGQIDSKQLTNTLVIVVRYFGGSLLGIPGLINAYKTAASLALQLTPTAVKQVEMLFSLEFPYMQLDQVMRMLKHSEAAIVKKEIQLFCNFIVSIPVRSGEAFQRQFEFLEGVVVSAVV
jgi:uncharacterized YigZ family protein